MTDDREGPSGPVKTVAYCGLVCGVCKNATPEKGRCVGCRHGGGDADCHQRKCCTERGLDGCWQCEEFPCGEGFFADDEKAWRGIAIGSVQSVQDCGIDRYVDRVVSRLGKVVEYGDYRHKDPHQIRAMLCEDPDR